MTPLELKEVIIGLLVSHQIRNAQELALRPTTDIGGYDAGVRMDFIVTLIEEVQAINPDSVLTIRFFDARTREHIDISAPKLEKYVHVSEGSGTRYAVRGTMANGRHLTRFFHKGIWDDLDLPLLTDS